MKDTLLQTIRQTLLEQGSLDTNIDQKLTHQSKVADYEYKQGQQQKKSAFNQNYVLVKVPQNNYTSSPTVALPKEAHYVTFSHPIDPYKFNPEFKKWEGTGWQAWVPSQDELERLFPAGTLRAFRLADDSFYQATLKFIPKPSPGNTCTFDWYVNERGEKYQPTLTKNEIPDDMYFDEDSFMKKFGQWILMGSSLLASLLLPGVYAIVIPMFLDFLGGVDEYVNHDNPLGAGMFIILSFMPYLGDALPYIGKVSEQSAMDVARKFATVKTQKQVGEIYNTLSKNEKMILQNLMKAEPKELENAMSNVIVNRVFQQVKRYRDPQKICDILNKAIRNGKLPREKVGSWFTSLGFRKAGFNISTAGLVIWGGGKIKTNALDNRIEKMTNMFAQVKDENGKTAEQDFEDIMDDPAYSKYMKK